MFKELFGTTAVFVIPVFAMLASSAIAAPPGEPTSHKCTNPSTSAKLQDKFDAADEGDVVEVEGDCVGFNYLITTDGLTLRGIDGAEITGDGMAAAITIMSHQVTIEDWAVIDGGAEDGIFVRQGAAALLRNITLITGEDGILVAGAAFAEVNNSNVVGAADDGIVAFQNGTVLIRDSDISNNGRFGVAAFSGGAVNINGGNTINNNDREGLFAAGGQLHVAAFFGGRDNTVQNNDLGEVVILNRNDIGCSSFARLRVADLIKSTTHGVTYNGSCAMPFNDTDIFDIP